MSQRGWRNLDRDTRFGNTPTRCRQNVMHQSKLEAYRCDELHLQQQAGDVSDLKAHPQPVYHLDVNGVRVATYRGDFEYLDRDGVLVTEDVKGFRTERYQIIAELFAALFGRRILETRRVRGRR